MDRHIVWSVYEKDIVSDNEYAFFMRLIANVIQLTIKILTESDITVRTCQNIIIAT